MRDMVRKIQLVPLLSLCFLQPAALIAEDGGDDSGAGQVAFYGKEPNQILSRWGAPKEKIEYESKREELWLYERARVLFRNGKVMEVRYLDAEDQTKVAARPIMVDHGGKDSAALLRGEQPGKSVVEDILSEIMLGTTQQGGKAEVPMPTPRMGMPAGRMGLDPARGAVLEDAEF